MTEAQPVSYRFKPYRLYPRERRLVCGDEEIHLEPKSFDALLYLVENAGNLVKKQDLVSAVWAHTVVTDNSLTRCIHHARGALGDDADRPRFIETVPGYGYRFVAPVEVEYDSVAPGLSDDNSTRKRSRNLVATMAIALAVVTGLFLALQVNEPDVPRIDRIAVLPLANLTGEPEQEYFVQGVHEALVAELSRASSIDVISRTSVMGFRDSTMDVPAIAERLNVDAIIEGSVLRVGDNLTVTAQLIATRPERHLWAGRYHRGISELFEITTEIVAAIASEVAIELDPEQRPASADTASLDPQAYDAYLLGRFYFEQRSPEGYRLSREYFRKSIDLDPGFAPAYAGLAHTFGSAAIFGAVKPADGFPEARRLARKALQLDDRLADGHKILAGVKFYWDWDWEAAERQVELVLSLNPNMADAYRSMSEIYSVTGRHEEAFAAIERAREIDPLPPIAQFKPSLILYLGRNYDEAISRSRAALEHYQNYWQGHWLLCISLAAAGRHDQAIQSCEKAMDLSGHGPMAAGALGYALALAGRDDDALAIAVELEEKSKSRYVGPAAIAMIYGALGRIDDAFLHLERAYELRDQQLVHAENAAFFDSLRADRRFGELRREAFRVGANPN